MGVIILVSLTSHFFLNQAPLRSLIKPFRVFRFNHRFEVKWFADGAEFNTAHEMLIWLWSSTLSDCNYTCKIPFAALPMKWFPTKTLRAKANQVVVEAIAWDSALFQPQTMKFFKWVLFMVKPPN